MMDDAKVEPVRIVLSAIKRRYCLIILASLMFTGVIAAEDLEIAISMSEIATEVIDIQEHEYYNILLTVTNFEHADLLPFSDGSYVLEVVYGKDGRKNTMRTEQAEEGIDSIRDHVEYFEQDSNLEEIQEQEASKTEPRKYMWFGIELGYGTYYHNHFNPTISYGLHVFFQTGNMVLSPYYTVRGNGIDYLGDLGVLYGFSKRTSKSLSSIAAGISLLFGNLEDGNMDAVGFPIEIQHVRFLCVQQPLSGVGLSGFCDLNPRIPSCGIRFYLLFGKLR
jgi:hypothetical protein